jgi:hypothetical protein
LRLRPFDAPAILALNESLEALAEILFINFVEARALDNFFRIVPVRAAGKALSGSGGA